MRPRRRRLARQRRALARDWPGDAAQVGVAIGVAVEDLGDGELIEIDLGTGSARRWDPAVFMAAHEPKADA